MFPVTSFFNLFLQLPNASSVRQLENDVYYRGGIHRLTIALRRLEAHAVGRSHRRFIQSMTEPPDHSIHMQLSVGCKTYFQ
jgi:hypothetical protein